jgi:23S rRNA (cytosine1962-C5)-methyltransferase
MPAQAPTLHLNRNVRHRILDGHPWVFASEVEKTTGSPAAGDCVELRDAKGRFLGSGIYNPKSQIIFRRYSVKPEPLDKDLLEKKIEAALTLRCALNAAGTPQAQRLVWSESDALPGLIIDRYQKTLVVQTLTLAMSQRENSIADILEKKLGAGCIIARNDAPVRKLEGLPLEKSVLRGQYNAPTIVRLAGLEWELDLLSGQKTGFYLDQVDNYAALARHATGKTVLDCFTNQGAFALACKQAGARIVEGIDQSAKAIASAEQAAARNKLEASFTAGNVFDLLPAYEREGRRYDIVVLDPPSFAKTRGKVDAARCGYKELHLRALRLLNAGGLLASFSCSHHVSDAELREIILEAASDTGSSLRVMERFGQAKDHPVLLEAPETEYLRGYLVEKRNH